MVIESGFVVMISWFWTWDTNKEVQKDFISPPYETMQACTSHRDMNRDQLVIEWEHDLKRGRARVDQVVCLPVYGFTRAENY